jgi:hypothetical protein
MFIKYVIHLLLSVFFLIKSSNDLGAGLYSCIFATARGIKYG